MPRFSANITMLFTELPFLERFEAAKEAGFEGIELQFPYDFPVDELVDAQTACGLPLVLFNLPPGDWSKGDRGIGALPGREAEFERGFRDALTYAQALSCKKLHVMAGIAPVTLDERVHLSALEGNLRRIAPHAAKHGITLLIEPLNTRDVPGYVLNRTEQALTVLDNVQADNTALQFDLYHRQIMQGDLLAALEHSIHRIGHIQIAGVPARNEPSYGEINYRPILERLDNLGYDGWVGCEYRPEEDTWAGLSWMKPYLS